MKFYDGDMFMLDLCCFENTESHLAAVAFTRDRALFTIFMARATHQL